MGSSECASRYNRNKAFSFFHLLGRWPHFILFLMLVWWHESRYEINYSNFFRGGWRGVLKWCNVRAHRKLSDGTTDFQPTLTYKSTSADLRQQHLTFFVRCVWCIIWQQKGKHCGVFRGEGCNACDWVWVHTMKSWLFLLYVLNCWSFGNQLSLTVHFHKLECLVKRLLCCIQGQGHNESCELQWMFAWTISLIDQT